MSRSIVTAPFIAVTVLLVNMTGMAGSESGTLAVQEVLRDMAPRPLLETTEGEAEVIDGDVLRIGDEEIRLFGIEAPQIREEFGPDAKRALEDFVSDHLLSCFRFDRDRYGRTVARCYIDGIDVGEKMVLMGWARNHDRFTAAYKNDEEAARDEKIGIWAPSSPKSNTSFYQELKSWQTGIGAFLGLIALMAAALFNAGLNRRRDERLRNQERKSLAGALRAEAEAMIQDFRARKIMLESYVKSVRQEERVNGELLKKLPKYKPDVFKSNTSKLGLLGPLIAELVIRFHSYVESYYFVVESEYFDFNYLRVPGGEKLRPAVIEELERIKNRCQMTIEYGETLIGALDKTLTGSR